MRTRWISVLFVLVLVLGGCVSSQLEPNEPLEPQKVPSSLPLTEAPPTQGDNTQMTPLPTSDLQSLIEKSKEDLAQRLSIVAPEISAAEAREVTWPDSSIGCPQEGMVYAQVLTPGYLILLEYANNQYEYHAGKGTSVTYCPNPTPPILDTLDNT